MIRLAPSARRSLVAIALGVGATSLGCGASSSEGSGVVATAEPATVELPAVSAAPEIGETVRQPLERSATVAIEAPKPTGKLPRECEEYLDRLTNCATLVPPQGRDAMLQAAQQAREAWLSVATDSNMFEALRSACTAGADAFAQGSPCGP